MGLTAICFFSFCRQITKVSAYDIHPLLNNLTTLLLGISCGALYFIRKDYPAPKASKLDGVVNAVLIVFALFYGVMGVWGLIRMVG